MTPGHERARSRRRPGDRALAGMRLTELLDEVQERLAVVGRTQARVQHLLDAFLDGVHRPRPGRHAAADRRGGRGHWSTPGTAPWACCARAGGLVVVHPRRHRRRARRPRWATCPRARACSVS